MLVGWPCPQAMSKARLQREKEGTPTVRGENHTESTDSMLGALPGLILVL